MGLGFEVMARVTVMDGFEVTVRGEFMVRVTV